MKAEPSRTTVSLSLGVQTGFELSVVCGVLSVVLAGGAVAAGGGSEVGWVDAAKPTTNSGRPPMVAFAASSHPTGLAMERATVKMESIGRIPGEPILFYDVAPVRPRC